MLFFGDVADDQLLILPVQHIGGALGVDDDAAAGFKRLQQQVALGIMAQGLEMAHAFHGIFNGFLIGDAALVKGHLGRKPLGDQGGQDLQLHLAHEAHMDLLQPLVPLHHKLRILFLQLPQLGQEQERILVRRQIQPVGHHRLQDPASARHRLAQGLAGIGGGQALHRHDHAGGGLLDGGELGAGVAAELDAFFRIFPVLTVPVGDGSADFQAAAHNFHPGQTDTLGIPGDFVDLGAESLQPLRLRSEPIQRVQKFLHALELQSRAKAAGEELPSLHQTPQIGISDLTGLQILL